MRTSDHLAAAADQVAVLLRHGQQDLADERELTAVLHTRDQMVTGLAEALRTVLARLDAVAGQRPAIQAGAAVLAALTTRTTTGPDLPPTDTARTPTDNHALSHTLCRSAQAWGSAARQVEAAAAQINRAGPTTPRDLRAAGADLAALAGALPAVDADLGAVLGGVHGLAHIATALRGSDTGELSRAARTAVSILDASDLPEQYHLMPPAVGVVTVTTLGLVPAAVRRVGVLLEHGNGLTGPQHAAVAVELARLAHQLRGRLKNDWAEADPAVGAALHRFAQAHLGLAHVWATTHHLRSPRPGSWDAPAQLDAVTRLLSVQAAPGLTPDGIRETTGLMVGLTRIIETRFASSLAQGHWSAAYHDGTDAMTWATLWPDYGYASRGETPPVSDIAPVEVHLAGHAVHEAWHDRGIPVQGYRLGDPIEDRRAGSPLGVRELMRIHVALEATTATGRGLQAAVGATPADATAADVTSAHRTLPASSTRAATTRGAAADPEFLQVGPQPSPSVLPIRRLTDLPAGLHRLAALLNTTPQLSPQHLRMIARTTADAALSAGGVHQRAGRPAQAAALVEHATLLTTAVQAAQRLTTTRPGDPRPLAQAQQINLQLAALDTTGIRLPLTPARAVADAVLVVTRALTTVSERMITSSAWLQPAATSSAVWEPTGHSAAPPAVLDRLTAAVAQGTRLTAVMRSRAPTTRAQDAATRKPSRTSDTPRPRPGPPPPGPAPRAGPRR